MNKKVLVNIFVYALLLSVLFSSISPVTVSASVSENRSEQEFAPLVIPEGATLVPNQYIVVLKSDISMVEQQSNIVSSIEVMGGTVLNIYESVLNGYSAIIPSESLDLIRSDPKVDYVEADSIFSITDEGTPQFEEAIPFEEFIPEEGFQDKDGLNFQQDLIDEELLFAEGDIGIDTVQPNATWGLDRVDQVSLPLNGQYVYDTTAAGVHVYIVDTGLRATHVEFTGRVGNGFTAINDGRGTNDCHGHGTHVSGTATGTTYGIAKGVTVHPVRVLDCSGYGSTSGVVAGLDWIGLNWRRPAVANMSLGGGGSTALDSAVNRLINKGVTVVVAAGNDDYNACYYSPARVPNAITVGSTTSSDYRSYFSNYGSCLDIFAPGSYITSAYYTSNTATTTMSGTSMASPHVAGAVALYLKTNIWASPATVSNYIVNTASSGKVIDPGSGSPNKLLYTRKPDYTPTTISPSGLITDSTPTYTWTKIDSASAYYLQLLKDGTTFVYAKTIPSSSCGATTCSATFSESLPVGNYQWRIRSYVGNVWQTYSAYKTFTFDNTIPNPISPVGVTTDRTPTYSWARVSGATHYYIQLIKESSIFVYSKTIPASACNTTTCSATFPDVLPLGSYEWRVRAFIDGVWKTYSSFTDFSTGMYSPFTTEANGWTVLNGSWLTPNNYYRSPGVPSQYSSIAYKTNFATLTYEVRMLRVGCDSCANVIYIHGSPSPLESGDKDWNNGYKFTYDNYGSFHVGYKQNGTFYWLTDGWIPSAAISSTWNVLKVTASGGYINFYINGQLVWSGYTTMYSWGKVGVGYYRDDYSTGNMLYVDYARLYPTAPATLGGLKMEESPVYNVTADPDIAQ